jgi:excisionase family DNA binding protein
MAVDKHRLIERLRRKEQELIRREREVERRSAAYGSVNGDPGEHLGELMDVHSARQLAELFAESVVQRIGTEPQPYKTRQEAAEYLKTTPNRITDLVAAGKLTAYRDGDKPLFRVEDLDAYVGFKPKGRG